MHIIIQEDKEMNKYQIQVDNPQTGCWNWITTYANTDSEALLYVNKIISSEIKWDGYYASSIFTKQNDIACSTTISNGIIFPDNLEEDIQMAFFKVNWNNYTEQLAAIASPEVWSNNTYPNNGILANYMIHTYEKLRAEKNIVTTKEYGLFNTGLFTKFYEPIYAYATEQSPISFITDYDLGSLGIKERPERANYFEQPDLLLFDWHYQINIQYKHILEDKENQKRMPQNILESGNIITLLNGAIDTMKKRVSSNYKLAIPQYFGKQVQLLLPLCLNSDDKPDLALAVTRKNGYYQGHTCLTLDMAYNNARLIAKPESNWLSQ